MRKAPHSPRTPRSPARRHNKIFREVYDSAGRSLGEQFVTANNALMMYSPFLEQRTKQ